jgi:hypothetical protein
MRLLLPSSFKSRARIRVSAYIATATSQEFFRKQCCPCTHAYLSLKIHRAGHSIQILRAVGNRDSNRAMPMVMTRAAAILRKILQLNC